MKRRVLFLLAMFMMVSYAEARNEANATNVIGVNNRFDDAVTFFERGIRFHVFLNGDFDFDSRFYRNRRNRNVRIFRDFNGRINRVGNVRIRYDFNGNVRRIGRVTMNYRRGLLRRVGNLQIQYNRWGDPRFYGNVGFDDFYNDYYYYGNSFGVNFNWNVGAICVYNDPFFYGNEFRNSYRRVREDANFIYYRANDGTNVTRDRILRRRKANSPNNNRSQTVRQTRRNDSQVGTTQRRSVQNRSTRTQRRNEVTTPNTRQKREVRNSSTRRNAETKRNVRTNRTVKTDRTKATKQNVRTNKKVKTERKIETKRKKAVNGERRRRS